MNIRTYKMCNTYVCVMHHSSYMSSVTHMWISSIWSSKNTLVDTLKIHLTRSDSLLLRKTVIVFLPVCTDIWIILHQRVVDQPGCYAEAAQLTTQCGERFPQSLLQVLSLWEKTAVTTKGKRILGDPSTMVSGVISSPPLWHGRIFLLHRDGWAYENPISETFLRLFPYLPHPTVKWGF